MDEFFELLYGQVTIWENAYREKHCRGKSEAQLKKEGWWKDSSGVWYCMKLGAAREKKFKEQFSAMVLGLIDKRNRKNVR